MGLSLFTLVNFVIRMSELREQMKAQLATNPLSGLADLAMNSVQLQWGWAILMLGGSLVVAGGAIRGDGNSSSQRPNDPALVAKWIGACVATFVLLFALASSLNTGYQNKGKDSATQESRLVTSETATGAARDQTVKSSAIRDMSSDSVAPIPAVVSVPKQWSRTNSWSGGGMKQTETFYVPEREWRILWKTSNEVLKNAGILQIYVYTASGNLVTLCANRQGEGQDISYVRGEPGEYYLQINSGNLDWDVAVEQLAPTDQHADKVDLARLREVGTSVPTNIASAIPDGIQELLTEWTSATIARDSARVANCYLPMVDVYFLKSGVGREQVKANKDEFFQRYTEIVRFQLSDFRLESLGADLARIDFGKAWDVRGSDRFIGHEREQLLVKKDGASWKIASERELQIFEATHTRN
jgi:ketosteroid isomerase-like protein